MPTKSSFKRRYPSTSSEMSHVPVSSILKSPENDKLYKPVSPKDPEIRSLAKSIKANGVLEPLVLSIDNYIISGHRRYEASKLARLKVVPCTRENILHSDPTFIKRLREYNRQRVKSTDEVLREQLVDISAEDAHEKLKEFRRESEGIELEAMEIGSVKVRSKISKAKAPFLAAIMEVLDSFKDYLPISDRQIHYGLLNHPPLCHASKPDSIYRNDSSSYKSLVNLLTRARLEKTIPFTWISDETRPQKLWKRHASATPFLTEQLGTFLLDYRRDYMQSQPVYIEILGEKNTIQSILKRVSEAYGIPFTIGRGFCSLRPRYDLVQRFKRSGKSKLVLLIMSDFDPDGEEIAHSFVRSLRDDFQTTAHAVKVGLTKSQIDAMALPANLKAKESSSNYNKFVKENGDDVYELESVPPGELEKILKQSIEACIDKNNFDAELAKEKEEARSLHMHRQWVANNIGKMGIIK